MPDGGGLTPAEFFGGGAGMSSPASPAPPPDAATAPPSGGGLTPAQFFGGGAAAASSSMASGTAAASPAPASSPSMGAVIASRAAQGVGDIFEGARSFVAHSPAGMLMGALAPHLGTGGKAEAAALSQPANATMDDAARSVGMTAPGDVQPVGSLQNTIGTAVRGAVGALPFGLEGGAAGLLRAGASGATGALGGEAAQDTAPEAWKPLAGVLGSVVAGGAPLAAENAARFVAAPVVGRVAGAVRPVLGRSAPILDPATGKPFLLSDIVGDPSNLQPVTATSGQAKVAGARLNASASDPAAAVDALGNVQQYVPGSMPTPFQATDDPGLGQLESAVASKRRDIFVTRAEQQRQARADYLQAGAGTGDPAAVGDLARSTLANMQADSEAQAAALRQGAQAATDAVGGQVPASADGATALQSFGAAMRDPLGAANQAAKANVARLFEAWDPDGIARLDMGAIKQRATDLYKSVDAPDSNMAPLEGEEKAILMRARLMPQVQTAQQFQNFYSRLGTAMRTARVDPAQAQTYGRLSQLMDSMHQAVSDTVARAAADDPTIYGRMEGLSGGSGDIGAKSAAAGQGYGGTPAQTPGTSPYGAARNAGTGRQANGGFGDSAGYSGISQTARSPAPESLVSFLTRNGGVYDDGGDLASMGAGKLRVGFLRRPPDGPAAGQGNLGGGGFGGFNSGNSRAGEPMQLDYARQKAIEAGYLPPDADLTDFKAAIGEDLRGNRQYVPEDWAVHQANAAGFSGAEEHAFDNARGDVLGAADRLGATLHPDEIEHAARLAVLGVDPQEAVQQAADASRHDYLAGRTFTGELGMPENASQAGMNTEPPMPPGGAFMTRQAADNLAAARAAHADRINTYQRAPGVGAVLARGPTHGTFNMPLSAVPSAIWSGGKGAAEKVSAYLRAGGDPEAVQNFAAFDLRKSALRADGALDPDKLHTWLGKHSEEMAAFPALRQKFDTAAAATRTMDDAAAAGVAAVKAHQTSALGRFIGDAEPDRIVSRMLGAADAPARMAELVRQVKADPAALAGLRHAVMARYLPLVQGTAFEALPKALTKEWQAIGKVLTPEQQDMLKATQADLARSKRSIIGTKLLGQSNTAQDAHAMEAHGSGGGEGGGILSAFLLDGLAEMGGHMVNHGAGMAAAMARMATMVGGAKLNAMRLGGFRKVDDLVAYAAAHPGLARTLMMNAPKSAKAGAWPILRRQLALLTANAGLSLGRGVQPGGGDQDADTGPADLPRVSAFMGR